MRMAGILGRFKRLYPEATVEFSIDQSRLLTPRLRRGEIDVAVIQVIEDEQLDDDIVLWSDELRWATHRDVPYGDGVVPLITYGSYGFYRPVSEPILERFGIEYEYTVNAPTSANVRAAVEAGLGVAVLGKRHLAGEVVEWVRAAELDPLPTVRQVVRTAPGELSDAAAALVDAIAQEFVDLPERQAAATELALTTS